MLLKPYNATSAVYIVSFEAMIVQNYGISAYCVAK